jgi:predicted MPP superfamily phosphohydrolase
MPSFFGDSRSRLPVDHPHLQPGSITRRSFMLGATAFGVGIAAFASTRGRHQLQITHRTFAIANLPDAFLGFRFVQISDIHLEEYTETWFLEHVVAQVNALNPELVLITGDFVSRGPRAMPVAWRAAGLCAEVLTGLKAPQRYAILGNHDVVVGPEHVIPPLQAHGTPVLVDSYVAIERGHDRLWLCGTDDATRNPTLVNTIPTDPRAPVLLMCHEPDYADILALDPRFQQVDLMLSGHSHGGQVRLPFAGPLILPPLGKKYVEGLFHLGRTQLYVNRGIGTVGLPFRLDCPAEITEITLVRA